MKNPNLEKKEFFKLFGSFVDVTPFENTKMNDHEGLIASKKNLKLSKMIYFN